MKTGLNTLLVTAAIGLAFAAPDADAALVFRTTMSNAVNYCQPFTPGPSSTIRNRAVGAENVGAATIAIACNFHSTYDGDSTSTQATVPGSTPPTRLTMWFANNNASGTITVTCTMLTGAQGQSSAYASTKTTVAIPAGGTASSAVQWTAADNPVAGATNLGNYMIGVTCDLPAGAVANDTYLNYQQENGL